MPSEVIQASGYDVLKKVKDFTDLELKSALLEHGNSDVYLSHENGKIQVISFSVPREWDSRFFERKMSTLYTYIMKEPMGDTRVVEECVSRAIEDTKKEDVACVISRVDLGSLVILRAQEKIGFRTYDIGCSFKYQSSENQNDQFECQIPVALAFESDVWELISIASHLYEFDHFHQDTRIGEEAANAMYGLWIRNLFFDSKCTVAVTRESGRLIGFVTIRELSAEQEVNHKRYQIDLIGVSPDYRGRGIGRNLLAYVLKRASPKSEVVVGTQLVNLPAVNLYLRSGFIPSRYYATLHLWH